MNTPRRFLIPLVLVIAIIMAFTRPFPSKHLPPGLTLGADTAQTTWTRGNTLFYSDPFLDKDLSDALCTLIVLGYAKDVGSTCTFQYEAGSGPKADTERIDYDTVQKLFTAWGVPIKTSASMPVTEFPFVVALNKKYATIDQAKNALSGDYFAFLKRINDAANSKTPPPAGAYIGGLSTVSKLFVIGPSKLDQYSPNYRPANDKGISASFVAAKLNVNNAIAAIDPVANRAAPGVSYADLNASENGSLSAGNLYKSYHGMIRAMVKYKTTIDNNSFIFEIALGQKTTKVSSCFPCSAYMRANGTPASSTHLGRGDSWNIPPGDDTGYRAWAAKIADWYKKGRSLFAAFEPKNSNGPRNASTISRLLLKLNEKNRDRDIQNIYLEALTFEGPFTDRIMNTLRDARKYKSN